VSADWLATPPPLAALRGGSVPARVGNVLVGTASWTEKTLLDSRAFYPPPANTPEKRLRYYARHFPVVEVDATYYALPTAARALAWAERTPADFAFGVKAYAALTGHPIEPRRLDRDLVAALPPEVRTARSVYPRDLPDAVRAEIAVRFHAALAPLREAGKLAYVLFQMPRWFAPSRESHALLDGLAGRFPDTRIAVEFRQAGWMTPERRARTLEFLRRRELVYVCVDEPQGTSASVPPIAEATADDVAVVRFHGRKAGVWARPGVGTVERFGYLYARDELAEWVPRLRAVAARTHRVHVLMNNCRDHFAVQNAKDLAAMLAEAAACGSTRP